ncbi:MAG: phosphoribosylanthranilate isomerase [Gammaproteobacteria bacterium]|nr:phosphoribosylanthranilate isomerase [Gammaproteobacteria bacterium]MDD9870065.1 phosphoribosylanthranilate isomerase [Gammaproteobacteria bacterium]
MKPRTKIKICGITAAAAVRAAAEAGADAVGLVFYPSSPRFVSAEQAAALARAAPPFVHRVGVFVNPEAGQVRAVLAAVALDFLQFHGDEPADFCGGFGRAYIKAVRLRDSDSLTAAEKNYPAAAALLVDAGDDDTPGGTGRRADWPLVPQARKLPLILAGGLRADNVAEAVRAVAPYAVDVSSGVESAPGVKDAEKIRAFAGALR